MKRYKVDSDLKKYIRRVVLLSFEKCRMETDKDGQTWCVTNISSDKFHKIVMRARCEKKTEETGLFYMTLREWSNVIMRKELLRQAKTSTCQIIDDPNFERVGEFY